MAADRGPAAPIGILCNPLGGRVRRDLIATRRAAGTLPRARYIEASDGPGIFAGVRELAAMAASPLVVIGGDGTFHAVLTALYGERPYAELPPLAVIPAGTTNMTAASLGMHGAPLRLLARLAARLERPLPHRLPAQPVLRVALPAHRDLYGMFFGAGIIAQGVRYFHAHVSRFGITGEAAPGLVVLRYLAALLTGRAGPPVAARLCVPGQPVRDGAWRMLLATTLDRMILGARPYWGAGAGAVHATAVRADAARLWRALWPLLRGGGARLREGDGYWSADVDAMELKFDGDFIIDGELYASTARNGPVTVRCAGAFRVLTPENIPHNG